LGTYATPTSSSFLIQYQFTRKAEGLPSLLKSSIASNAFFKLEALKDV
jgi:hypothetical protein